MWYECMSISLTCTSWFSDPQKVYISDFRRKWTEEEKLSRTPMLACSRPWNATRSKSWNKILISSLDAEDICHCWYVLFVIFRAYFFEWRMWIWYILNQKKHGMWNISCERILPHAYTSLGHCWGHDQTWMMCRLYMHHWSIPFSVFGCVLHMFFV